MSEPVGGSPGVMVLPPLLSGGPLRVITLDGIVRREERYLAARFGEPDLEYTRRVRRWR